MNQSKITQLLENGLRLDDQCEIRPYQGRKMNFNLNRTEFEIILAKRYNIEKDGYKISLPALNDEEGVFSLTLVSLGTNSKKENNLRYLLKSKNHEVFKVNNNYVYECLLQRGDIVDFGYNRFIFLKDSFNKNTYKSETDKFLENKLIGHNINILIEGETGTGKSRLARKIHEKSGRMGNFVHLNLSAFSSSLIESELFGHVKGSFTGADRDKNGAIIDANKGTLFLDEIDSISTEMQTKLLLFLDLKKVRPVGKNIDLDVDVRLIFAAGRKLKKLVQEYTMRKDFYFRLMSGVQIYLPSLCDKPELVNFICNDFAIKNHLYISNKLLDFYKNISWPGNIRELLAHLEKKMILANGKRLIYDGLDSSLLNNEIDLNQRTTDNSFMPFSEMKKDYFLRVFMYYEENYLLASKVLQVSPQTLRKAITQPANKE